LRQVKESERNALLGGDDLVRFTGVLGILAVLLAAWLGSTDRKHIRWRTIAWGLGLQVTFAFLVLRFSITGSVP
jgi:nucleoside permease NupC